MKICFLNHNLRPDGGAGKFALTLTKYLTQNHPDIEVTVLTAVGSGHVLELVVLPSRRLHLLLTLPKIRRIFKNCDLIHALDGYPYGVIAALASIGLGKKIVITAIGTGAIQPLYSWPGWLLGWAYRRADSLVAVSGYTRREILKKVPNLDIAVINHAVEAGEFAGDVLAALRPEELKTLAGLKPYVLSVGAWKKRKGYDYSFPAFGALAEKFPRLNYVVCGTSSQRAFAEKWGVGGKVFFFKGVRWPFLKALYREAEIFILLPYDADKDVEGFGFAFLEAAAAGLPVVGTKQSGAEDAIRHGENGFLVEPRDAQAAAKAALLILSSAGLRKRFSASSLALAQKMNWPQVAAQYSKIYYELLARVGRSRRSEP